MGRTSTASPKSVAGIFHRLRGIFPSLGDEPNVPRSAILHIQNRLIVTGSKRESSLQRLPKHTSIPVIRIRLRRHRSPLRHKIPHKLFPSPRHSPWQRPGRGTVKPQRLFNHAIYIRQPAHHIIMRKSLWKGLHLLQDLRPYLRVP